MKKIFLYLIILIVVFSFFLFYKIEYVFSDLKDYSSFLLNVSGMVFTVMGIWIAFIYPQALLKIVKPDSSDIEFQSSIEDVRRIEGIVLSIIKSGVVVISVVILFLLKTIFVKTSIYHEFEMVFKSMFISLMIVLTLLQLEAVWHVLVSNVAFINDLHKAKEKKEGDADL